MSSVAVKRLSMLWRRELWEHRGLWMAPLVAAVLLLLVMAAGALQLMKVNLGPLQLGADVQVTTPAMPETRESVVGGAQEEAADEDAGITLELHGLSFTGKDAAGQKPGRRTVPQKHVLAAVLVMLLVVSAFPVTGYLMETLYADRRDRSVLFWRSLPVSDTATVLAKLSLAAVVLLGTWLLAALVSLPVMGLVTFTAARVLIDDSWTVAQWLLTQGLLLAVLLVNLLWYAPVAAVLLVVSAWARRSPYGWALGVPLLAMMAEDMLLDSKHLARLVGHRLTPVGLPGGLQDPWLWVGLVAAAGLVALAIRLRRNAEAS